MGAVACPRPHSYFVADGNLACNPSEAQASGSPTILAAFAPRWKAWPLSWEIW